LFGYFLRPVAVARDEEGVEDVLDDEAADAAGQPVVGACHGAGIEGARGVVLNLTGDPKMSMRDVDEAVHYIHKSAHPEVNVIVGLVVQEEMAGRVQATLIATDFDDAYIPAPQG